MNIKSINQTLISNPQNQVKTDDRKTVADQNSFSRPQDNSKTDNKTSATYPVKLSITPVETSAKDNPLAGMSLEEARTYLEGLIKNNEIKKAEKEFSELAKADWEKAAAIIEDRTNGVVTNLNKDYVADCLVPAMYTNGHGNLADKIFNYLGDSQSPPPNHEEITPDDKEFIPPLDMNENIDIDPENIIKLSVDSINGYKDDNPLLTMTAEEARTYLKGLVDTGQQQQAAEEFVALIDINFQKAADIIQTYNTDSTETHIDKTTALEIFKIMAQNNYSSKINDIFQLLDPLKIHGDLQYVCHSLACSSANTRSYKYIVWAGVRWNGMLLYYASTDLKDDKDVVLAAVEQYSFALYHASDRLKDDKDVVLAAVEQNGGTLQYASDRLKDDKDVVLVAVATNTTVVSYASANLKNDETFQIDLISASINVYDYLINYLGINPASDNVTTYYQNTKSALNLLGIEFYTRFFDTKEIIRNRYSVSSQVKKDELTSILGADYFSDAGQDNRPICVMTFAVWDWNDAFATIGYMHKLTKAYRVIYYDVGSDTEFANNVVEATVSNDQQTSLLIIGGHGGYGNITFNVGIGEQGELDMTDSDLASLLNCTVADSGHVIDQSCNNGEYLNGDTSGIDNIAEFNHYILWPNAYCHADKDALHYGQLAIQYNNNGLLGGVTFDGAAGLVLSPEQGVSCTNLYIVEPKNDQKTLSRLSQNYPNPFSDQTTISFEVPADSKEVALNIYNGIGQLIRNIKITDVREGENTFVWNRTNSNGAEVAPGIYICTMELDGQTAGSIKMIVQQ